MSEATKTPMLDRLGCELSLAVAELEDAVDDYLDARARLLEHGGETAGFAAYRAEGGLLVLVGQLCAQRYDERMARIRS